MPKNTLISLLCLFFLILVSCKQNGPQPQKITDKRAISKNSYAKGFSITQYKGYKKIIVNSPWPDAQKPLIYIVYPKGNLKPVVSDEAIYIPTPVQSFVCTSTTDIPMIEALGVEKHLKGFPNTNYISSEKTRKLIDQGLIKNLGDEPNLNTEVVLELKPEMILAFSSTGDTKNYNALKKSGIPIIFNGSWMESHPIGRTEWIKFIAAFFEKEEAATLIFDQISTNYVKAAETAKEALHRPTIFSGNMYQDIWYVPGGNSYLSKIFEDANVKYLWEDNSKTGSIPLSFESVLDKSQNADLWIGAGYSSSINELKKENNRYTLFNAFNKKNVYSYALKKGVTGGLIYFELGIMRPDLVLKDVIQIAHPELLQEYEPHFFSKLE